jgi:hypothetical protein
VPPVYNTGVPGVITHEYSSCGNYWVNLSGYDDEGYFNSTVREVRVPCGVDADASASPKRIHAGEEVTFYGTGSTGELDRSLWTFEWTFDDGHPSMSGEIVTRPEGTILTLPMTATLTVNDSHCNDTANVTINPKPVGNHTIRVYGEDIYGPGDTDARDPETENVVENPPYTIDAAPFWQWEQAPPKDFVTFNPAFLSEKESRDELYDKGLYGMIHRDEGDAFEKVFWTMWYEPLHWDKDVDASGALTCVIRDGSDGMGETMPRWDSDDEWGPGFWGTWPPSACEPGGVLITPGSDGILQSVPGDVNGDGVKDVADTDDYIECDPDEAYPAIMQEFTYMLVEPKTLEQKPEPTHGIPGQTAIAFPVGMRTEDVNDPYGYGLTSFDADFDAEPDIVYVESEISLFEKTNIAADFDGSGTIDPLDGDEDELSGDELVVFTTETKRVDAGERLQFLDHMIEVVDVYDTPGSVKIKIWYTGDLTPKYLGEKTIQVKDMILAGNQRPVQGIIAVENGGDGTNVCDFPTGPWFAWVEGVNVDLGEPFARIMVGRALGHTHTAMEDEPYQPDLEPGDPWFTKRFYVDGHEYKVVAIETIGAGPTVDPGCDLDEDDDGIMDEFPPFPEDESEFKYITIRTPIPKWGEYDDPKPGYLIEQHSVRLQPYGLRDYLSVMPPFNYEHTILTDVQEGWHIEPMFIGELQTYTIAITQLDDGNDHIYYIEEDRNPQFTGELLEKYNQWPRLCPFIGDDELDTECVEEGEWWYAEQWHTLPDEYTEFSLPEGHGLYLLTSAFWTKEAVQRICIEDPEEPEESICIGPFEFWNRVKFWYDGSCNMTEIYKDNESIRVYGRDGEGAGSEWAAHWMGDPLTGMVIENPPYTDPVAPFNPQEWEAPRKDSLTFNPAYMDEFYNGEEDLADLYAQIGTEEGDAREKVFFRLWYEPEHWDKDINANGAPDKEIVDGGNGIAESFALWNSDDEQVVEPGDEVKPGGTIVGPGWDENLRSVPNGDDIIVWTEHEGYPAIMEEFTYIYLDIFNQPSHGQPGISTFAFPIGTRWAELWNQKGYGLTTFDADFDLEEDAVTVHSEESLAELTGIDADFDGDGVIQELDLDYNELSGNEIVIFAVDVNLEEDESAMLLDHMVKVDYVQDTPAEVTLTCYYTGGGYEPVGFMPEVMSPTTVSLKVGEMAILGPGKHGIKSIPAGGDNRGDVDGAWFVYVDALDTRKDTASLLIGRALGDTWTAMDDPSGEPDLTPGDPWYMKRFYVDGQEYKVVAINTVPEEGQDHEEDEEFEFKYITIRTPVPKEPFQVKQHSQDLQDYGVCNYIPVMPPFNYDHTAKRDIWKYWTQPYDLTPDNFPDDLEDMGYKGETIKNKPPLMIHIVEEDKEPRFKGELKERYCKFKCQTFFDYVLNGEVPTELANMQINPEDDGVDPVDLTDLQLPSNMEDLEIWWVEQFHTIPDEYTALELPKDDQLYLLTSSWLAPQAEYRTVNEWNNGPRWMWYGGINWYTWGNRVKFWYDPTSPIDIYVNWDQPRDSTTVIELYDVSEDGYIDREELVNAIIDYLLERLTQNQLLEVLLNYLIHA